MEINQDDPEKRIAELESQLAEQKRLTATHGAAGRQKWKVNRFASPTGDCLSAEQVRSVAFSKPPIGKSGYNQDEVDAFLDLIESALVDPTGHALMSEHVHDVSFARPPIGRRGYNEDEVDAFLDLVEQQLRTGAAPQLPIGRVPTTHAAGPQGSGRRISDVVSSVFSSFWVWYLLLFVLLAGGGAGLRFLGHFVRLDGPAPDWMGIAFFVIPVVMAVAYVVRHLQTRNRRRHRYWATGGGGDGGGGSGCSGGHSGCGGGHGGCGGGSGCGGGGCGGGGH
ncbi:MAG TPA: DivIVA domain-containing protein [Mycobacterium sp.]|nr:DivIVA domain-containing protein [Mycobacterium sp.]HTY33637.1 DivIVA domain-containing protein [Mycobacterium sp.]